MLTGATPFKGKSAEKTYLKIKQCISDEIPFKSNFDPDARSLILSLLQRNPNERLGARNIDDLKKHPFFKPLERNWETIRLINVPYVPPQMQRRNRPQIHSLSQVDIRDNKNLSSVRDSSPKSETLHEDPRKYSFASAGAINETHSEHVLAHFGEEFKNHP